jgi:hypothetical protein
VKVRRYGDGGQQMTAMMRIQYFNFGSNGEPTERSVVERCSGDSELILTQWKGSVIQHGGMSTLLRGEASPGREKRGDDVSWADTNLTVP